VALADDPAITAAVQSHMTEHQLSEGAVRRQVRKYLDEIIPHFNVLSYYRIGYNVAKILVNLLYKTSVDHQDEPSDVLSLPRQARLPELERLAREMLVRIGAIIPVTPVPLAAAALLSFGQTVIQRNALLERMDQLRDRLLEVNGKIVRGGARIGEVWDRAWRMLRMRRLVVADGDTLVVLPRGRPLLEFYANSIAHLIPIRGPRLPFHKAHEVDTNSRDS
jgi:glycerol-3-phosphate O-acyltransferase